MNWVAPIKDDETLRKFKERLKQMDPKFFCDLFQSDKLSQQTFVNTKAKKVYCETCAK